jgi:hypothetical protein
MKQMKHIKRTLTQYVAETSGSALLKGEHTGML